MLQQSEIVIGDRRYPVNAGELRAIHAVGRLVLACGRGSKALDRVQLPTRGEVLQFWTFGARVSRTAGDMASASWFETRLQAATAKHAPPPDPARAPAVPNLLAPAESTPKPPREPLVNARELAHILGVPLGLVHRKSAEGVLPRHKIGHRTVRYDVAEVRLALQAPRRTPAPQPPIPRRRIVEPGPVHDLPAYDWPPRKPPDATLARADRRGAGRS